ncbi:MAG: methylated-DNA--[protein]-cysteine S-methyltransferase [Saprospiraceae bacterium]|nr:methylated-DNA--[protein]-cysteine S-methyltransferase [Saprospiraceae bacterium]
MITLYDIKIETPIGMLEASTTDKGIYRIHFLDETPDEEVNPIIHTKRAESRHHAHPYLQVLLDQMEAYFSRKQMNFNLPLDIQGTDFQKRVWNELLQIPYGKTRSYLEQTKALGDPLAIRAVANANGKNPIAIVVPCHRVIGSDGSLTGYAGGLQRKRWLLDFEFGQMSML